jgi:hypothetical protein
MSKTLPRSFAHLRHDWRQMFVGRRTVRAGADLRPSIGVYRFKLSKPGGLFDPKRGATSVYCRVSGFRPPPKAYSVRMIICDCAANCNEKTGHSPARHLPPFLHDSLLSRHDRMRAGIHLKKLYAGAGGWYTGIQRSFNSVLKIPARHLSVILNRFGLAAVSVREEKYQCGSQSL